jgi:hypothetical protein
MVRVLKKEKGLQSFLKATFYKQHLDGTKLLNAIFGIVKVKISYMMVVILHMHI